MAASPSQIKFTTMDIKKNNITTLDLNTNKNKIYDDNKELIDIEPIDWNDM